MSATDVALPFIKRWEGYAKRLANDWAIAYQDIVGVWTLAYGFTGPNIKQGSYISREQADAELQRRILLLMSHVIPASPVLSQPENENRLSAVLSFSYNLGFGRYLASTLKRKIDARLWRPASLEFRKWNLAGGHRVAGLVARRAAEQTLFLTAVSAVAATPQIPVQSDAAVSDQGAPGNYRLTFLARFFSWLIGKIKHQVDPRHQ